MQQAGVQVKPLCRQDPPPGPDVRLDDSCLDFELSPAILLSYCKSHQQCPVPGSSGPSVRLRSYHEIGKMPTIVVILLYARK